MWRVDNQQPGADFTIVRISRKLDINKTRETNDKLLPGVGTLIRGSVITPTPPSSPTPRPRLRPALSDGDDSVQGVIQRVATEYLIVNLNLSQESDPDVFFNTVPEIGQSVIQKAPQENLPSDLNLSQESESDIFFEHNSGFLHSSGSLDSTLPVRDQERIAWQAM